jgi:ketosteroid isomerase-like protein
MMSTQENKQLVIQGYQKFQNQDIKGVLEMCADDIEWEGARSEDIPFSGTFHGKQETAQYFSLMDQVQEIEQFEPQEFIAEGDKVVVLGQSKWKVKATGETYDNPWVHIFTVQNGKLTRFQQYNDSAAALEAFRPYPEDMQQATRQQQDTGPSVRH